LRSETLSPVFMVACVRVVEGRMQIVAYAYWDKDNNLKHFLYSKKGHYSEMLPDDGTIRMLIHKLQRLQDRWGV